ncbi:MAG: 16S rRNA (guanine(527)-N(7))-methyltransferase RsmG [Magnetococcales bacterium]|nr:16S rRNA (guanine(527)-N(7))-methyltransferase RsmG [Magnetococcales bacterium]
MDYDWEGCFNSIQLVLGYPLNDRVQQQLQRYTQYLLEWNRTYNLIGPAAVHDLLSRHILDSVSLIPLLPETAKIADMGSGAGLPGLILAMLSPPSRQFHLYEANQKKSRFLNYIATELQLIDRAHIHKQRVEELHPDSHTYDITTCRALASLEIIAKLSRSLLKPDGVCLAMKGRNAPDEIHIFKNSKLEKYFTSPTIHPIPHNPEGMIIQMRMVSRETGMHP